MYKRLKIVFIIPIFLLTIIVSLILLNSYLSSNKNNSLKATASSIRGTKKINYLAMGDIISTGFSVTKGYVERYKESMAKKTNREVDLINISVKNMTSDKLLSLITTNPDVRELILTADVITFNTGFEDLREARNQYKNLNCGYKDNQDCFKFTVNKLKSNFSNIIKEIRLINNTLDMLITMDIYYPYVDSDTHINTVPQNGYNDFQIISKYYKDVNHYISDSSKKNNVSSAEIYLRFNGVNNNQDPVVSGLINTDKIYPNDIGHEIIAEQISKLKNSKIRE